jgi:alanine racemase
VATGGFVASHRQTRVGNREVVGSEVELWGRDVSVDDVAARAGTIAYELLCNAKRASKRYVGL